MPHHKISIIMPAYNAEDLLRHTLIPLIKMRENGEVHEVLVVDDGSSDGTMNLAKSLGAQVLKTPQNGGPGLARNVASKKASGEILWFVDSDVIAHADGARLVDEAFREDGVVAVFGSYDDAPPAKNFGSQYKNLVHRFYHQQGNRDASTFWAGCGAIRATAFAEVEGFDTDRYSKPAIEDIELGYRLRDKGGRIVLVHELQSTHLKYWTIPNILQTDIFQRAFPWSRLMLERGGLTDDLNVSQVERARAIVAGFFFLSFLVPFLWSQLWFAPIAGLAAIIAVNIKLFRFFWQCKSLMFAFGALIFHQFYYIYSSTVFVWCLVEQQVKSRSQP